MPVAYLFFDTALSNSDLNGKCSSSQLLLWLPPHANAIYFASLQLAHSDNFLITKTLFGKSVEMHMLS